MVAGEAGFIGKWKLEVVETMRESKIYADWGDLISQSQVGHI